MQGIIKGHEYKFLPSAQTCKVVKVIDKCKLNRLLGGFKGSQRPDTRNPPINNFFEGCRRRFLTA
jgi:hypothetical protein